MLHFPSIPVAVTAFLVFVVFAKRFLDCQGDCPRCYSISKLSQLLYAFIADANPILLPVPSPALLRLPLPHWMVFALCRFPSFFTCRITYGTVIRLSTYCKVHSQIQLISCCEGFHSYLKERFLHFNNRIISVFGANRIGQFVYSPCIIQFVY
mgnify:CR=1 FL=1